MHDIFACSQSLHKCIHDCQMVLHGVASNHQAVRLKIALSSVKLKARAASWGTINWPKILSDKHTCMVYNKHLLSLTTLDMDCNSYQEVILQVGALTATHHKRQCKGWFQMSCTTLAPLLKERNQVLHATKPTTHPLKFKQPCELISNASIIALHMRYCMPKQSGMLMSAQKSMTCAWNHILRGSTFVCWQKANLHTTNRK